MTALKQYDRLEATGLWRPAPQDQRREVVLTFGDATLVISDGAMRPLAHWSLAAINRSNPGERPAVFLPGPDAAETLEIDDAVMIEAIEKIRKSILRRRPKPGRLRVAGLTVLTAALLFLIFVWLPGALTRQTLSVVPPARRAEIGQSLLTEVQFLTGAACRDTLGLAALGKLADRIFSGGTPPRLVVVPDSIPEITVLPGRILLINRRLVEDFEDPAVVAGYALSANAAIDDPLSDLLHHAGLLATLKLVTSGSLPKDALRAYAEETVSTPTALASGDVTLNLLGAAGLSSVPLALAIDPTGEATRGLIESDPMQGKLPAIVLNDGDWVALQGICGG
jgi:hypothetical protein